MLDTHRIQALGLKTCVVAKYAFPSVHHHSHLIYMRRLRKEKCYIQVGLARSADPGPDPHPVPQGGVDLALTEVLAQAAALPRGHSPRHSFPTICWAQKWASTEPQPPRPGRMETLSGEQAPSFPPSTHNQHCITEAAGFLEDPLVPPTYLTASEILDNPAQLHPIHTWLLRRPGKSASLPTMEAASLPGSL